MKKIFTLLALLFVSVSLDAQVNFDKNDITSTLNNPKTIFAADIDSDNDIDVVSSDANNALVWYENNGSQVFAEHIIDIKKYNPVKIIVSDIDADNDMDLFIISADSSMLIWYENDGNQNFTATIIADNLNNPIALSINDLDKDTFLDIIICNNADNKFIWFKNDGNQNFTANDIPSVGNLHMCLTVIDIDKDNDMDIVSCSYTTNQIFILKNDGSQNFTNQILADTLENPEEIKVTDVNNNDTLDIVAISKTQGLVCYFQDTASSFVKQTIDANLVNCENLEIADFTLDNDGDIIVSSNSDSNIFWYENIDNTIFKKYIISNNVQVNDIQVFDINKDNREDVVIASTQTLSWFGNKNELSPPILKSPLNQAANVQLNTNFEWFPVQNAEEYQLLLSLANTFTNQIIDTVITANSYEINKLVLEENTKYYWKVRAKNTGGESQYSQIFDFKTDTVKLDIPQIISPKVDSAIVSYPINLNWNNVPLADSFALKISEYQNFVTNKLDTVLSKNEYTIFSGILSDDTKYYWKVSAQCKFDSSDFSAFSSFISPVQSIIPPTMIEPDTNQIDVVLSPTFRWNKILGALSYTIQISKLNDFSTIIADTSLADSTFILAVALEDTTNYFWRARTNAIGDTSDWSVTRKFKTIKELLATPILNEPLNNSKDLLLNPIFKWQIAAKATEYQFQLAKTDSFKIISTDTILSETTLNLAKILQKKTNYFWRVRSINTIDTTDWSAIWTFKTNIFIEHIIDDNLANISNFSIGDITKNNFSDILPISTIDNSIYLYANDGNKVFAKATATTTDTAVVQTSLIDIDNDDDLDIFSISTLKNKITLYKNNGNSFIVSPFEIATDSILAITTANLFKDTLNDIIALFGKPTKLYTYNQDSTARYVKSVLSSIDSISNILKVADMNNDGLLDIITASTKSGLIFLFRQQSDKTFIYDQLKDTLKGINSICISDINNDNFKDIIASSSLSNKIVWYSSDSSKAFTQKEITSAATDVSDVKCGDIDLDGDIDIVAAIFGEGGIAWFENIGAEVFTTHSVSLNMEQPTTLGISDIDNNGLLDVVAYSLSDTKLSWFENLLIDIPDLISPINNKDSLPINTVLDWSDVKNATGYNIELSTSQDFSTSVIKFDTPQSNFTIPLDSLNNATTYFWRVNAYDDVETGYWSETWQFKTEELDLQAPALLSPNNTAQDISINPTFVWTKLKYADNYIFQLSEVDAFTTMKWETTQADTQITAPANLLDYFKKYYWRVATIVKTDTSDWSAVFEFTTIDNYTQFNINLHKGWNRISSYIQPKESNIDSVFSNIKDKITIVYDQDENVYSIENNINQLLVWDYLKTYDILMKEEAMLTIFGKEQLPENNILPIPASTFTLIPYISSETRNIEEALNSINANLKMAESEEGKVYIPTFQINQIGKIESGMGLKIYLSNADSLKYPAIGETVTVTPIEIFPQTSYFNANVPYSNNLCHIIVDGNLPDNMEIVAFGEKGEIFGSSAVQNGKAVITVIGDDLITQEIDGVKTNEFIEIRAYNPVSKLFETFTIDIIKNFYDNTTESELTFQKDKFYIVNGYPSDVIENNEKNVQVIPNPISSNATIIISSDKLTESTITLYNMQGMKVQNIYTGKLFIGNNEFLLNSKNLPIGSYLLVIYNIGDTIIKKIEIIR